MKWCGSRASSAGDCKTYSKFLPYFLIWLKNTTTTRMKNPMPVNTHIHPRRSLIRTAPLLTRLRETA